MHSSAGVDRTVVFNRAVLPVQGGFNRLLDDGVDLVSEAGGAGIGTNVAEEFVQLSFAQALQLAAIVGAGRLRGEDEVGLAADNLRIEVHEIKSEEGRAVGGDPGVLNIVILEVGEIILDGGAFPERSLRARLVFLGEWVHLLSERPVGPGEAEKERVECLPLGLVAARDLDDAGKGELVEAAVAESEIAAEEMAGSTRKTCASSQARRFTCCFGRHKFSLDAIELTNESRILWVPVQQSAKTPPLLPICIKAEDFDKLALDMVDPKDGHLLWSKLIIAIGQGELIVPGEEAGCVSGVVGHHLGSLEFVEAIWAAQLHLDQFVVHVSGKLKRALVVADLTKETFAQLVGVADLVEEKGEGRGHGIGSGVGGGNVAEDFLAGTRLADRESVVSEVFLLDCLALQGVVTL
ncbi:hypothetical protein BGW80DRAFT_1383032 [Lactifluus volemus]|nr:hypothetical protein BGW80DRAFT_1383032 [Lactifluus volemus]